MTRFGAAADQTIHGSSDTSAGDYLNGMGGDDTLIGGAGNDTLSDGLDFDMLVLNQEGETGNTPRLCSTRCPAAT